MNKAEEFILDTTGKPIKPGDTVQKGDRKGIVSHYDGIAWLVKTEDGEWVLDRWWERI